MIRILGINDAFPPVENALTEQSGVPGLLAASRDISAQRLLNAYPQGIFPWYTEDQPVLWWSPNPRMVLKASEFKISHSFKKTIKKVLDHDAWEVRVDTQFEQVMRLCASTPRLLQSGTWINEQIIESYTTLFQMGYAHSIETWYKNELVGGLYGVSLGRMFFGESMFTKVTDASKISLATLIAYCLKNEIEMIDCQQKTEHLARLGGSEILRVDFLKYLSWAIKQPSLDWKLDKTLLERFKNKFNLYV